MSVEGPNILKPWNSEDHETSDDETEDDREEARRVLRKRRFNMELLCAISAVDDERTKNERIQEVKRCLNNGASYEARCQGEMITACHIAAFFGEDEILELLLERGASPSAKDSKGRQPHHLAAAKGHQTTVRLLICADTSLINSQVVPDDLTDIEDSTLDSNIHDHSEFTSLLPSITEGSTALHVAMRFGFIGIVDFLLENDAECNIKNSQQQTPLDVAGIDADHSVPGTIVCAAIPPEDLPLDDSFKISRDTKSSFKNLLTSKKKKIKREKSQIMDLFSAFIQKGISMSSDMNDQKVTPLHTAVTKDEIDTIKQLIEMGFQMNTLDEKGRTPVHLAVELHLKDSLNILLEKNIDAPNFKDGLGRTPLHLAVQYEWMEGVQTLLEQKTNLKLVAKNGESVLHVAARKGNRKLLDILLQRFSTTVIHRRDNDGYTPLFRAVEKGDLDCVDMLLKYPKHPNFQKYLKKEKDVNPSASLLHVAVKSDAPAVLERLIKYLEPIPANYLNYYNDVGYSPLHLSAERGFVECTRILLNTVGIGIDLLSDKEERTALHFAAKTGNCEITRMLLDESLIHNVNLLNVADIDKREPLLLSASEGHRECTILLLSRGANLAAKDGPTGSTALDIIFHKLHHPVQMLGDLLDNFMEKEMFANNQKEDSPDLEVKLDFTTLLADVKDDSRQLGVIDAINNSGYEQLQQKLFLHPLVESFLYLKWKQLRFFFNILVCIYIIHILSLTGVATMTYAYRFPLVAWICRAIVLLTLIPIICWELLNASRFERFYLLDGETWVKWAVIITTGLVAVLPELYWARYLTSISVLLAWIELLFLYAKTFTWGLIVQMFFEVAKNVIEVLTTFIFLILGFAFAFLVLFNERYPFTNLWTSLCKVLVMMVELDYNGAFTEDDDEITTFNVIGRIMYLGFIILVVMVLINLIQSMSVNDVAKLEAQGRSKRLAKKASFLSLFESFCYKNHFFYSLPQFVQEKIANRRSVLKKIFVKPNQPTSPTNPLPDKLRSAILQTVFNRDVPSETDSLNNKVDHLVSDMEKVYEMIQEIKESLHRMTTYND